MGGVDCASSADLRGGGQSWILSDQQEETSSSNSGNPVAKLRFFYAMQQSEGVAAEMLESTPNARTVQHNLCRRLQFRFGAGAPMGAHHSQEREKIYET